MREQLPPIQFKNPNVQFALLKNRKPTPFIDIHLGRSSVRRNKLHNTDVTHPV